jgi:WD40 repeat protein
MFADSEKMVREFSGHTDAVYCLAIASPNTEGATITGTKGGALLATGSEDGQIRLWGLLIHHCPL